MCWCYTADNVLRQDRLLSAARLYLLLKSIVSVPLGSSAELIIVHQPNGRAKAPIVSNKIICQGGFVQDFLILLFS